MVSHGERARELNLWASKLRTYKTKHVQNVNCTAGYTLHCQEADSNGASNSEVTKEASAKDLQHCVKLLSHLLDSDGSLMAGPTAKRSAPRLANKPKKKIVHVIPRPKAVSRNATNKGISRSITSKQVTQGQKKTGPMAAKRQAWDGATRRAVNGTAKNFQWVEGETAMQRIAHQEAAERKALQSPTATHDGQQDVTDPVPYNTRLPSSTPNTTLQKEPESLHPDTKAHKNITQYTKPFYGVKSSGKTSGYECVHGKRNAPGLPLVFLNTDYSLTSGQSHPLNATDQVNVVKSPEPELIPKLVQGKVEFQPNPAAWFQGLDPDRVTGPFDGENYDKQVLSQFVPKPMVELSSLPKSTSPFIADVPRRDMEANPLYDADSVNKDRVVDFSLYTNPGETSHGGTHPATTQAGVIPKTRPYIQTNDSGHVTKSGLQKFPSHDNVSAHGVTRANIIEVPTAEIPVKLPKKSSNVPTLREHPKGNDTKLKRVINKETTSACPRCAKFDKKKQSLKNKENILKKTIKSQSKITEVLQPPGNDAATQCSPEKAVRIPSESPDLTPVPADPSISKQASRHMQTLQRLLSEMRMTVEVEQNSTLDLMMKQVEQTAAMFVPGLGGIDWRTELELALQPLRTENAQLRRRLRINNQQMKDKNHELELKEKPDPSFHTVHLELERHKLAQDFKEVSSSRDQLRDRLKALQAEQDHLRGERAKLLEIMVNKDTDLQKAEQKWSAEITRYHGDAERAQTELSLIIREKDIIQGKIQTQQNSVDQRDKEIDRLRSVVRNLQSSMTRLLAQLRDITPPDDFSGIFTDDQGNDLLDNKTLDGDSHLQKSPHTPAAYPSLTSHPAPASARRALPFSQVKSPVTDRTSPKHVIKTPPSDPGIMNITSSPHQRRSWNMDETDYVLAPGSSPIKQMHPATQRLLDEEVTPRTGSTHTSTDSPTVKELLTPLKDRMQSQYKRLSAGPKDPPEPPGASTGGSTDGMAIHIVPEEDTLTDLEIEPLEVDSTLLGSLDSTDSAEHVKHTSDSAVDYSHQNVNKAQMDDASRYSMTDYFNKYPHDRGAVPVGSKAVVSDIAESGSSGMKSDGSDYSRNEDYEYEDITEDDSQLDSDFADAVSRTKGRQIHPAINPTNIEPIRGSNTHSSGHVSIQESMYKGTELDTSISTIDDGVSLASSVGTIDDSAFQQGLADLDDNIARIQEQLKLNLAKYS